MPAPDLLEALAPAIAAFDALDLPFVIGGSVARWWPVVARTTLVDDPSVGEFEVDHGTVSPRTKGGQFGGVTKVVTFDPTGLQASRPPV